MLAKIGSMFGGEASSGDEENRLPSQRNHVNIPFALNLSQLMPIAEDSVSDHFKSSILAKIDKECQSEGCLTMRIEDMDNVIWPEFVLLDNNGKHPFLKRFDDTLTFEVMLSSESGRDAISRSIREIAPNARWNKNVYIIEVQIHKLRCDYHESLEIRLQDPESDWMVWWPKKEDIKGDGMTMFDTLSGSRKMMDSLVSKKIQIPRGRLWALYVAGCDVSRYAKKIGDEYVLLERNLDTVLIMETLRSIDGLPEDLARELKRCALHTDMKYFKMEAQMYEKMMRLVEPALKTTDTMDTKLQIRRYDGESWTNEIITIRFEVGITIAYRVFPDDLLIDIHPS